MVTDRILDMEKRFNIRFNIRFEDQDPEIAISIFFGKSVISLIYCLGLGPEPFPIITCGA